MNKSANETKAKVYDVPAILARGFHVFIDLGDAGAFDIEEVELRDGEAIIRGTWTRPDGKMVPGEIEITEVVPPDGACRAPRALNDVLGRGWGWAEWTVEEAEA